MESCDVLIVGGGPAGSSCARRLCEAGLDVVVMDKSVFPRDKVCAGWITPAVINTLELDIDDYRQGRVFQPIEGFRTGLMEGPGVYNDYKGAVSYAIRRFEFDHYLLSHCGARLMLSRDVEEIERPGKHWIINGNIRASMLIGAGGHFCPVARHLGAKVGKSECAVSAREMEFKMSSEQQAGCRINPGIPELFFYPDLSGYGWVFRKDQYLNIGIGREDTGKIAGDSANFLQTLRQQGKIPDDITTAFKGHAYLLYDHARRKTLDDGVLLVGDAAGLAYTESGEGIRPAIESGLMAADVIINAKGEYLQQSLMPYEKMINKHFGQRHYTHRGAAGSKVRQAISKIILANRFLSRHILLDRYFLRPHLKTI